MLSCSASSTPCGVELSGRRSSGVGLGGRARRSTRVRAPGRVDLAGARPAARARTPGSSPASGSAARATRPGRRAATCRPASQQARHVGGVGSRLVGADRGGASPSSTPAREDGEAARPAAARRAVSRSQLHSTTARSVWCRGSAVRLPPVSSRNRSDSRAATSATGSDPQSGPRPARWPAAARPAAGRSRRPAPASTRRATSSEPTAAARSTKQPHRRRTPTASAGSTSRRRAGRAAGATQSDSPAMPSGSRLVASTRSAGQRRQQVGDQRGGGVEQVLAVVDDEQAARSARSVATRSASRRCRGALAGALEERWPRAGRARPATPAQTPLCVAHRGQLDQPDAVGAVGAAATARPRPRWPAGSCRRRRDRPPSPAGCRSSSRDDPPDSASRPTKLVSRGAQVGARRRPEAWAPAASSRSSAGGARAARGRGRCRACRRGCSRSRSYAASASAGRPVAARARISCAGELARAAGWRGCRSSSSATTSAARPRARSASTRSASGLEPLLVEPGAARRRRTSPSSASARARPRHSASASPQRGPGRRGVARRPAGRGPGGPAAGTARRRRRRCATVEPVARCGLLDHGRVAQGAAQPGDQRLQGADRVGGRVVAPDRVDELGARDDRAGVDGQPGDEPAQPRPGDVEDARPRAPRAGRDSDLHGPSLAEQLGRQQPSWLRGALAAKLRHEQPTGERLDIDQGQLRHALMIRQGCAVADLARCHRPDDVFPRQSRAESRPTAGRPAGSLLPRRDPLARRLQRLRRRPREVSATSRGARGPSRPEVCASENESTNDARHVDLWHWDGPP